MLLTYHYYHVMNFVLWTNIRWFWYDMLSNYMYMRTHKILIVEVMILVYVLIIVVRNAHKYVNWWIYDFLMMVWDVVEMILFYDYSWLYFEIMRFTFMSFWGVVCNNWRCWNVLLYLMNYRRVHECDKHMIL